MLRTYSLQLRCLTLNHRTQNGWCFLSRCPIRFVTWVQFLSTTRTCFSSVAGISKLWLQPLWWSKTSETNSQYTASRKSTAQVSTSKTSSWLVELLWRLTIQIWSRSVDIPHCSLLISRNLASLVVRVCERYNDIWWKSLKKYKFYSTSVENL